jgi:ADP-ribose pyrophosphatase
MLYHYRFQYKLQDQDHHLRETPLESRQVYQGHFLDVRCDHVRLPSGAVAQREYIRHPGAVMIVPLLDDGRVVVERQFRYPLNRVMTEFPAGKLDAGEPPMQCAVRELREETGHTPVDDAAVVLLGATRPNAAFMNNRCFTVFVPRARKTHQQDLDPSEEVEVVRVARSDVNAFVRDGARRCAERLPPTATDTWLDNSLVTVALHLWHLHELAR